MLPGSTGLVRHFSPTAVPHQSQTSGPWVAGHLVDINYLSIKKSVEVDVLRPSCAEKEKLTWTDS